jgi:diguanylate cyclase (GGDEF)-like protein
MSKSIFIADSDAKTYKMLATLLESKGYQVSSSESGKDALLAIKEQSYDLIIAGEELTDIDGIGWIEKLRRETAESKLIFISARWREGDLYQQLRKEFGVSLVVHRPINKLLFGAQVDNLFHDLSSTAIEEVESGALALKARFTKLLPERIVVVQEAINKFAAHPADKDFWREARRQSHNLKGTARSCGYEMVGDSAERLEMFLNLIDRDDSADTPGRMADLKELCGQLKSDVELELGKNVALKELPDGEDIADSGSVRVLVLTKESFPKLENISDDLPISLHFANSIEEATAKASRLVLDAALIDLDSQDNSMLMNFARELRNLPGNENLPIGFIRDPATPNDLSESMHAGGAVHIEKPLRSIHLAESIQYLIGAREGGRPRILAVDDDEDFAHLISTVLGREGMIVKTLNNPSKVLSFLDKYVPDLILLDVNMPALSGFELCRMLRANPRWHDLPIIFLTGEAGLEARMSAFDAGGDDYLPKPVSPVELTMRVKIRLERARLLRERADKDVLTGLYIRRSFIELVNAIQSESVRTGLVFTIALLDVDLFKKVNDTYGHIAGDRVLAHLGTLLRRRFRAQDVRARWGGEEFIMAFRLVEKDAIKGSLERALTELRGHVFEGDHGDAFSVTFSSGLASFPQDGQTFQELLAAADRRLYIAKQNGRNQAVANG